MLLFRKFSLPVVRSSAFRFSSMSRPYCFFPSASVGSIGSNCMRRRWSVLYSHSRGLSVWFIFWDATHDNMWRKIRFVQTVTEALTGSTKGSAVWFDLFGDRLGGIMASKQRSKPNKLGLSGSKAVNSPSSSTTSSSKQYVETSIDGQSSPASSSARSKPRYFYSESLPVNADSSKENVTVTIRFRPLRCIWLLAVRIGLAFVGNR